MELAKEALVMLQNMSVCLDKRITILVTYANSSLNTTGCLCC
jgi:hypothetical protein